MPIELDHLETNQVNMAALDSLTARRLAGRTALLHELETKGLLVGLSRALQVPAELGGPSAVRVTVYPFGDTLVMMAAAHSPEPSQSLVAFMQESQKAVDLLIPAIQEVSDGMGWELWHTLSVIETYLKDQPA